MHYLSTYPSGFDEIAETVLTGRLIKTTIIRRLDGALEYETNALPKKISEFRFFHNSFVVLKSFNGSGKDQIEKMVKYFLKYRLETLIRSSLTFRGAASFRVMTAKNNQPVSIKAELRSTVESRIKKAMKIPVSRAGAQVEVWFAGRNDSTGHIMVRFTKRRVTEKELHPGELKPETAHLLILCSEPSHQDRFLDPFCGYGGILLERMQTRRATLIHGVDTDAAKIKRLKGITSKLPSSPVQLEVGNARHLATVADGTVTRIVTDPPWGEFHRDEKLNGLYRDFLKQFDRILAPRAIAVLLTGRNCPLADLLGEIHSPLKVRSTYNVLISGKKATVHALLKK